MNAKPDRKMTLIIILIAAAVLLIIVGLVVFTRCNSKNIADSSTSASESGIGAEIYTDTEILTDQERFLTLSESNTYLFPKYETPVDLAMADGAGKPQTTEIKPDSTDTTVTAASESISGTAATVPQETSVQVTESQDYLPEETTSQEETTESTVQETVPISNETTAGTIPDLPIITINPNIIIIPSAFPTLTMPDTATSVTEPVLTILTPAAGDNIQSGGQYKITWDYNSSRSARFDIFLSKDNGINFDLIVSSVTTYDYLWIVPDMDEPDCIIRVDAVIDGIVFASDFSDMYSVLPEPTPSPIPTPTPTSTPVPPEPTDSPVLPYTPDPDMGYKIAGDFFVSSEQNMPRWFLVSLKTKDAAKLIWQVSKVPYTGLNEEALLPPGLLVSGELDPFQAEFAVDFNAVVKSVAGSGTGDNSSPLENKGAAFTIADGAVLLPQSQYTFYIRVIALDINGNLIGDAGEGMSAGYGTPTIGSEGSNPEFADNPLIEVWTAEKGMPSNGTYGYQFVHPGESGILAHPQDKYWDIEFRSVPENTRSLIFQVATSPFGTDAQSFTDPQGLVFNMKWGPEFTYQANSFRLTLPLLDFVPSADDIENNTVQYYVRMVFFRTDSQNPSEVFPVSSETLIINYNNLGLSEAALDLLLVPKQEVEVKSYVPFTSFEYYFPVQWEDPNASSMFEVSRQILWNEMAMTLHTPDGTIYPYPEHYQKTSISTEDYQALLDKYLPVGASFKLTITKDFWDDFVSLLSDIYNAVRNAYEDLKNSAASIVADNFPWIDDDTRDALRSALKAAINVGLSAIGLPPTLPNFEALAAEGFDYCLQVAIDEACKQYGVSPDQITAEMRDQLSGEVKAQMEEIVKINQANPLGVDYLRPARDYQYQPAYFAVLVQNFSDKVSPGGTLTARYHSLTSSLMYFYESAAIPIPELQPGDHVIIQYFWAPDIGIPWVDYEDNYNKYYFGNGGDCEFTVTAKYDVPDVQTAAKEQGLTESGTGPFILKEFVYDHSPTYTYSFLQAPCEFKTGGDDSVSPYDFAY